MLLRIPAAAAAAATGGVEARGLSVHCGKEWSDKSILELEGIDVECRTTRPMLYILFSMQSAFILANQAVSLVMTVRMIKKKTSLLAFDPIDDA